MKQVKTGHLTKEDECRIRRFLMRPIIKQGRDIPMQNELPVYDVVTGVISSRKAYVALLCAEKIQEMSRASERMVCPSAEIIKKVIEEILEIWI